MAYVDDLRAHETALRERLEMCDSDTAYAQLSRQWLNVRKELEQICGESDSGMDDLIGGLDAVR